MKTIVTAAATAAAATVCGRSRPGPVSLLAPHQQDYHGAPAAAAGLEVSGLFRVSKSNETTTTTEPPPVFAEGVKKEFAQMDALQPHDFNTLTVRDGRQVKVRLVSSDTAEVSVRLNATSKTVSLPLVLVKAPGDSALDQAMRAAATPEFRERLVRTLRELVDGVPDAFLASAPIIINGLRYCWPESTMGSAKETPFFTKVSVVPESRVTIVWKDLEIEIDWGREPKSGVVGTLELPSVLISQLARNAGEKRKVIKFYRGKTLVPPSHYHITQNACGGSSGVSMLREAVDAVTPPAVPTTTPWNDAAVERAFMQKGVPFWEGFKDYRRTLLPPQDQRDCGELKKMFDSMLRQYAFFIRNDFTAAENVRKAILGDGGEQGNYFPVAHRYRLIALVTLLLHERPKDEDYVYSIMRDLGFRDYSLVVGSRDDKTDGRKLRQRGEILDEGGGGGGASRRSRNSIRQWTAAMLAVSGGGSGGSLDPERASLKSPLLWELAPVLRLAIARCRNENQQFGIAPEHLPGFERHMFGMQHPAFDKFKGNLAAEVKYPEASLVGCFFA